jgi:peroxiredoxin Q/BCP
MSNTTPEVGDALPKFTLLDQHGQKVTSASLKGEYTLVYFYPKADSPGCTTQACGLRDIAEEIGTTRVIGVSPDQPAKLEKFDTKYGLGFTLLSDPDHELAEAFGVWAEKKLYGKVYMGVVRSAFLFDAKSKLVAAWPKISPKDTPTKLLAALKDR